jgi:hypothetical protein
VAGTAATSESRRDPAPTAIVAKGAGAPVAATQTAADTGHASAGASPLSTGRAINSRSSAPGDLQTLISVEFDEIDAKGAVRAILKAAGMNYAFRADLGETRVTCSLKNVAAEDALQTILKLIDSRITYRIEGGTVLIVNR